MLAWHYLLLLYSIMKLNLKIGVYGSNSTTVSCPKVWIDYIYLDTDERRRFAQVSHEYLIDQLQVHSFNGNKNTFDLNFNHPVN